MDAERPSGIRLNVLRCHRNLLFRRTRRTKNEQLTSSVLTCHEPPVTTLSGATFQRCIALRSESERTGIGQMGTISSCSFSDFVLLRDEPALTCLCHTTV